MKNMSRKLHFRFKKSPVVALLCAVSVLASSLFLVGATSSAQEASEIAERDRRVAEQENKLNAERCRLNVDTAAVLGGCPDFDESSPSPAPNLPSAGDIATRDMLLAQQEALLNAYRTMQASDTSEGANREIDLATGNAMQFVFGPRLGRWLFQEVSPAFNDASMVFRYSVLAYAASFDAVAPYHETAVGIYSRVGRRPASESENNLLPNTAISYAVYRLMLKFAAHRADEWRAILTDYDLDPDDSTGLDWPCDSSDRTDATAAAIGNLAAKCTMDARRNDGFNPFGDVNGLPLQDPTGYTPLNTPF